MGTISILVSGVCGKMGRTVAQAVNEAPDLALAGGVDPACSGADLGEECLGRRSGMTIDGELPSALSRVKPQVMIDFTAPAAVMNTLKIALTAGVRCVVGTTGLTADDLNIVRALCDKHDTAALIAPNFSVGAVLMMRFAQEAAARYEYAQIFEMHHPGKLDAPSGTAMRTAERMASARSQAMESPQPEHIALPNVIGGQYEGIGVHAARMDGVVADQLVLFGGPGETLRIEHRTTGRECFMPGVLLAVRNVVSQEGLVIGLENLL